MCVNGMFFLTGLLYYRVHAPPDRAHTVLACSKSIQYSNSTVTTK